MIYVESAMLACLCTAGIIGGISDIRTHLIPNKIVMAALLGGVALHGISIAIEGMDYYGSWLINMLLADIISFILYFNQITRLFFYRRFYCPARCGR